MRFKACRTRRTGIYFCFVSGLIGIQSKLDLYSNQFYSPEPLPSIVKPFSRTPLSWRSPKASGRWLSLLLWDACVSFVFPESSLSVRCSIWSMAMDPFSFCQGGAPCKDPGSKVEPYDAIMDQDSSIPQCLLLGPMVTFYWKFMGDGST